MGDAVVEGGAADLERPLGEGVVAEIVPEAERDRGEVEAAPSGPAVGDAAVAVGGGKVGHRVTPPVALRS